MHSPQGAVLYLLACVLLSVFKKGNVKRSFSIHRTCDRKNPQTAELLSHTVQELTHCTDLPAGNATVGGQNGIHLSKSMKCTRAVGLKCENTRTAGH